VVEQFNDIGPFRDNDGDSMFEIEKNTEDYPREVGKLWTGNGWLTVADARKLRDWLNKVIP
jgi:hypothetical protein